MPCPIEDTHTSCPKGYIAWHEWAKKKSVKYRQAKCAGCGKYAIWIRKTNDKIKRKVK